MNQREQIEQIFDAVFIGLAGLSDSTTELDELDPDSDSFFYEVKSIVQRYDDVAARARDKFTELRKQLLALPLTDKLQAKLDACARQVEGWERTAPEMGIVSGSAATIILAAELRELLNG